VEDGDPARRSKHALRRRCGKEGSVTGTDLPCPGRFA